MMEKQFVNNIEQLNCRLCTFVFALVINMTTNDRALAESCTHLTHGFYLTSSIKRSLKKIGYG